jgi:16S rRNA (cytosine967-C5)-methyltransferase
VVERHGRFADEVLDEFLRQSRLDARDRALAWELTYGVLRRRATLDWQLHHLSAQPFERLPLPVKTALRLGAYQLLCLDRIPSSAAVNESVNLVKAGGAHAGRNWTGFVNAVLRTLIRKPAAPWPDAALDPVASLAVRYSCPVWLVERWLQRIGAAQTEALCQAMLENPPLTIRTNSLRTSRESLQERLKQDGCHALPTRLSPWGLVLDLNGTLAELPAFRDGDLYVEDEAAQLVPPLLDPQPEDRVLDACAAPGGKTTHLAALMQNRGEIVAVDRSPQRLRLVEENCRRLGVDIVRTMVADARKIAAGDPFDRILVDAPCSGLGVLRRHPEGKWQKDVERLTHHAVRQLALLERVGPLLRPGGVLVYSTCSTEPEENEQVIDSFCARHTEFHREVVTPWLPPDARTFLTAQGDFSTMTAFSAKAQLDGFFAARLRKGIRPS